MRPVTRASRTLRFADNVLRDLDKAYGHGGGRRRPAGPGVRRDSDRRAARDGSAQGRAATSISTPSRRGASPPDAADVAAGCAHHRRSAQRPLVLTGRGALGCRATRSLRLLDAPARSTSTRRKAAASCPASMRRWSARCAAARCRRPTCSSSSAASSTTRRATARRRCCPTRRSCASATTGKSCARTAAARSSCSPTPALALDALAEGDRAGPRAALDTAWTQGAARRARAPRRRKYAGALAAARRRARTATCIRTASSRRCRRC